MAIPTAMPPPVWPTPTTHPPTLPMPAAQAEPGAVDVTYVLLLLQGAFGVLAVLGLVLIMAGNPIYAVVPLVKPVVLFLLAAGLVRGWRRARMTIIVIETLGLAGYGLNLLIGFAREADVTVNLVTVLTNVALPLVVIWLCVEHIAPARTHPERVR